MTLPEQILEVRRLHQLAVVNEVAAKTSVDHAKEQRAQIHERLKSHGVDPATAEDALKQAEIELEALTAQLSSQLTAAIAEYSAVVNLYKASGGQK